MADRNPEGSAGWDRGGPGASQPGISKDRAPAKPARTLHGLHSGGHAKGERRVPAQSPLSGPVPPTSTPCGYIWQPSLIWWSYVTA